MSGIGTSRPVGRRSPTRGPTRPALDPGRPPASRGPSSTTAPRASPPASPRPGSSPDSQGRAVPLQLQRVHARACSRRSRCAASPVNVNYRYLEDELVYLLDNSDAEALLFHGALGDRVAKVARPGPDAEGAGSRSTTARRTQDCAVRVRGAARRPTSRCRAIERSRRRPLHPLHRRHHRHAQGRDVAQRGPLRRRSPTRAYALVGRGAARRARRRPARSPAQSSTPARRPRAPARVAADARHRRVHQLVPGAAPGRRRSSRSSRPQLRRRTSCGRRSQRERVTQMAIVGDAFAQADGARARRGRGRRRRRTTSRRSALIISSGVMWTAEVKQALMARGQLHLPRLARLERRRRLRRARSACPAPEPTTAKFSIGDAARRCSPRTAARSSPAPARSGCSRSAGHIPLGYYKDAEQVGGDVPRRSTASAGRSRATSRRSRPTARSRCSAAARSSSTPAARRSSPKRSRRR